MSVSGEKICMCKKWERKQVVRVREIVFAAQNDGRAVVVDVQDDECAQSHLVPRHTQPSQVTRRQRQPQPNKEGVTRTQRCHGVLTWHMIGN